MNPTLAVITPTKNRIRLLCEAMDSVQGQTFDSWEHLIIDDGSDDGTEEEVARRAAADSRVRYIKRNSSDKVGANVCRNLGFRQSRADLTVFLDSDDLLRRSCLQRRVEVMHRNLDLDFAVFRAGVFTEAVGDRKRLYHSQDPGDDLLRFLSLECVWEISGPVWRRGFLEKIGCFDSSLLSMQDLEMHVRALCAGGRYSRFSDVDHDIRWQHDHSKTSVLHFNAPVFIQASDNVRVKLLETVRHYGLLTWTRQRALTGLSFGAAECWVRSGQLRVALLSWDRNCHAERASWLLQTMGCLMLCALWLSRAEDALCSRLVNKWKGWVRFRQEPALLASSSENPPPVA
jgi:glycosyltransferase involved in cell wall biosynthesis